ncbi:MAG TPA: hypothetical protein VLW50_09930 [Streptosporangiaceae bacterium]|nr:hypothetical protein [Streptosporangiaceae bacterium]
MYDGRARKRPSGASDFVQRIYMLLDEHPEGMTLDEIHAVLREGWLETDYYRAYEQYIATRQVYNQAASRRKLDGGERGTINGRSEVYNQAASRRKLKSGGRPAAPYGSDLFKSRAQQWAISKTLNLMKHAKHRTARRCGDKWYKGERAPRITVYDSTPRPHYITHDWASERRAAYQAATSADVRREELKAELFKAIASKSLTVRRAREVLQLAYDHLCGF